ncbi:hypothetical protein ACFL6D_01600 [Spirochaetota bacterium]
MDPIQYIKEAEIINDLRKNYEYSPLEKLPLVKDIKHSYHLGSISDNVACYIDNLIHIQEILLNSKKTAGLEKSVKHIKTKKIEKTHYGFIALCDEEELYSLEGDFLFSEFQNYQSCAILTTQPMQGRIVLHWEYQDCSSPDGCKMVTNFSFAKEILHNRNYYLVDRSYDSINSKLEKLSKNETFSLICNVLQNCLVASFVTNSTDQQNLITNCYLPLRRLVRDFMDIHKEVKAGLSSLENVIESVIMEINSALLRINKELLVPVLSNIPFNKIAEILPGITAEYERYRYDEFKKTLVKTKEEVKKIDEIFEDEELFGSLMKNALSKKE